MMSTTQEAPSHDARIGRSTEARIEIAAPVEAVWKALTDAEELERWFPLDARATPGVGGSIWLKWEDVYDGDSRILIWEPNRHLRTTFPEIHGTSPQLAAGGAVHLATDYYLEGEGGKTVLRIVSSGFGPNTEWDAFYEGVDRGWRSEIRSLRHYLERHRGEDRTVAWARAHYHCSHREAWERLTGRGGWIAGGEIAELGEGDRFALTTATGDTLRGSVLLNSPPREFTASVENLRDAYLRLQLEDYGDHREAGVWLAGYGIPDAEMRVYEARWTEVLKKVLAGSDS
jgi:uncharacterized protein YndB with AHSA1/START domain